MAEPSVDIAQLSTSQQEALQTYTSVTDQDLSAALPLLQRSQWNVQIAIAKFFDGEAPDPVEEARVAQAAADIPRQAFRRETLLDSSSNFSASSTSPQRDPAPRVVPQPESRSIYKPPALFSLVLAPVNLLYRLISGSIRLLGYLFPFLPRLLSNFQRQNVLRHPRRDTTGRRPLNPQDTASRFVREFGEEFGSHSLPFFGDGYAQAYDLAKHDLKFLLVVLVSPEHDDTPLFVRETLLAPEVESFINDPSNNIILWAGNVQDSEAYQVSIALNCTKFPFAGLVVHTPDDSTTSMSTVARITGLQPSSAFIAKLQTAIAQYSPPLNRVRTSRAAQEATRNLRQEQDSAYERSLAQDRERTRLRRDAEAARAQQEAQAKAQAEALEKTAENMQRWKRWKAQHIAPEPNPDARDITRLSIRMPSGDRVMRKFASQATLEDLYAFIECHDMVNDSAAKQEPSPPSGYEHRYAFKLVSPMPRIVYDLDSGGCIGERIGRSANLIVEPINDEDEE